MPAITFRSLFYAALLLALALVPVVARWLDNPFYIGLFTRIVIFAIATVSLNLLMGFGGMISLGHAVYLGIGGYAVGILAKNQIYDGWLQFALAIGASALYALVTGLISLRTRGVYFIMITLAFAQMVYFAGVGAYAYGGDDGMTIHRVSTFGDWISLRDKTQLYYFCFTTLLGVLYLVHRIVNSRFGLVVRGAKSNDRRMNALGFPTFRYRLACFVISGAICGLAGALYANQQSFISPVLMHWSRSGDLIVMAVLGGLGSLLGPVGGTIAFLLLEEILSSFTKAWKLIFGPLLVLVVIFARRGIDGMLGGKSG